MTKPYLQNGFYKNQNTFLTLHENEETFIFYSTRNISNKLFEIWIIFTFGIESRVRLASFVEVILDLDILQNMPCDLKKM